MSSIDNLKKSLIKDDETKASLIMEEASSKAEDIIKDAKLKAEAIKADMKVTAERDAKERKERMLSRASLEARNQMLYSKQEAIDMILNAALDRVAKMNKEDYEGFIEKLLLNSVETGDEEVIFSEDDKGRIDPSFITRVNQKLNSQGKKGMLRISAETRNIHSGFILKRGGLEVNNSVDSQIRVLRDDLEGEIAGLIFEGR